MIIYFQKASDILVNCVGDSNKMQYTYTCCRGQDHPEVCYFDVFLLIIVTTPGLFRL